MRPRNLPVFLLTTSAALATIELSSGVTSVWVRPGWEVPAPATFINTGTATLRVLVEMDPSGMPPGSYPYFCWGPSCYAPGVLLSPDTVTIAPGTEERSFKAYVYAESNVLPQTAPLRFVLRDAYTGAPLLRHTVEVHFGSTSSEPLQVVWTQIGVVAPVGASAESFTALYNAGTSPRRVVARIDPLGTAAEDLELCLGDTCYGAGVLRAPDTLRLEPRQLYAHLRCRIHIRESSGSLRLELFDPDAAAPIAQSTITFNHPTGILAEQGKESPCGVLVVREWFPAEFGTVLELYTVLGQLRVRLQAEPPAGFRLQELEPGLYGYRLYSGKTVVCSGVLLRLN